MLLVFPTHLSGTLIKYSNNNHLQFPYIIHGGKNPALLWLCQSLNANLISHAEMCLKIPHTRTPPWRLCHMQLYLPKRRQERTENHSQLKLYLAFIEKIPKKVYLGIYHQWMLIRWYGSNCELNKTHTDYFMFFYQLTVININLVITWKVILWSPSAFLWPT